MQSAKQIIKDFSSDYLNGDLSRLANFDFARLKTDKKYGCPGRNFDCDDTNLIRAIFFILYNDIYPELSFIDIGTGRKYRGDTINTFNSIFGTYDEYSKTTAGLVFSRANESLVSKAMKFHSTYHTLGNFILLPNQPEFPIKRSYTLNTFRGTAWKDFFDIFLLHIKQYIEENNKPIPHFTNIMRSNEFFFGWIKKEGGIPYLKKICYLEDYFSDDNPCSLYSPYITAKRSKSSWNDDFCKTYLAFSDSYIEKATFLIENRAKIVLKKLIEKME